MSVTANYGSTLVADTDRRPSPSIWSDIPCESIRNGDIGGMFVEHDFCNGGLITSPTTEAALIGIPGNGFGSSGSTITYGDDQGGTLVLTEATDNEGVHFKLKPGVFQVSALKGMLGFETRVKISAITTNLFNCLIGLMDDIALTATVPITASAALATTMNYIGFFSVEGTPTALNAVYQANGVTPVTNQAAVHTWAADTYVKLGMKFFPNYKQSGTPKMAWYVNGVEQSTLKTVPDNTGTDFPADVRLNFHFGFIMGSGATSSTMRCDWFKVYQLDA